MANQYTHRTLDQRFWDKVEKSDDCWNWKGARFNHGYGQFWNGRRPVVAHRYSWELHNGPIPDGLHCLHVCDTPDCVNPSHLFLGTHQDNMTDMVNKGRSRSVSAGEANRHAKLTEGAVRQIRKYHAAGGCTQSWLAIVYGVGSMTINSLLHYKTWKHI